MVIQNKQQSVVSIEIEGRERFSEHLAGGHHDVGASRNCNVSQDDVFCSSSVQYPDRGCDSEHLLSDCHRHCTLC
jgi:hypothetical protein